jgi:hypothetical protein
MLVRVHEAAFPECEDCWQLPWRWHLERPPRFDNGQSLMGHSRFARVRARCSTAQRDTRQPATVCQSRITPSAQRFGFERALLAAEVLLPGVLRRLTRVAATPAWTDAPESTRHRVAPVF